MVGRASVTMCNSVDLCSSFYRGRGRDINASYDTDKKTADMRKRL